jgi:hypothetical protein
VAIVLSQGLSIKASIIEAEKVSVQPVVCLSHFNQGSIRNMDLNHRGKGEEVQDGFIPCCSLFQVSLQSLRMQWVSVTKIQFSLMPCLIQY